MKKITLILLFVIPAFAISKAQSCLSSGIFFTSQQEIDDFSANYPGCIEIEGNVDINDSSEGNITNLNGLSQLTSLGGYLKIIDNNSLLNLSGLDNIETISGELRIGKWGDGNNSLNSLTGLESLTSIGGNLAIYNNPQLENMTGLNAVSSVGDNFWAWNNNNLINFNGLDALTSIGIDIGFGQNPNLVNLNGLESLTTLGAILYIKNNALLENFSGLDNLNSIGFYIFIYNNGTLSSLDGLENVTSLGGRLEISNNSSLADISGIQNIDASTIDQNGTDLIIVGNPMLSVCEYQSICDVVNDPNKITNIHDNLSGCDSETEIETACSAIPIEMLYFNAKKTKEIINLTWSTASEINNKGWNIQRSNNGQSFETIAWIGGSGNSRDIMEYEYKDAKPNEGLNIYRLEQVDFDGKTSYSKHKSIYIEGTTKRLFPNPANNHIFLDGSKNGQIKIKTINGTTVLETYFNENQAIDISRLKQGMYNLLLIEDSKVENFRFIKSK